MDSNDELIPELYSADDFHSEAVLAAKNFNKESEFPNYLRALMVSRFSSLKTW